VLKTPQNHKGEKMNKLSYVSSEHSTVLMKWLSKATKSLGSEVARNTYVVGGAIRNFKLNMPVKDVDIVLDSVELGKNSAWLADELADLIPAETETVSDNYGVAKVYVKTEWVVDGLDLSAFSADGDAAIEIVDARSETYSDDTGGGYKPSVSKSTIKEDIFRRDFTYNTLMWRLSDLAKGPEKAEIIDLTGCGLKDLEAGESRCPLDPEKTFYDDPTRMLRAVKFLVKYGLKVPKDTSRAIYKTRWALKKVHHNRVYTEIQKILNERTWKKVVSSLEELGLVEVLSEIANENEAFRVSLSTSAKKLPYRFFIDLLDLGLPIKHEVSFLDRKSIDRLRDLSESLTREQQDDLVKALKTPGWAIKDKKFLPSLAKGLRGSDMRGFMMSKMDELRDLYLENPLIIYNADLIKSKLRESSAQRVASRHLESRLFGLFPNYIGWQDLKRFQDQLQWMFKQGQHTVKSRLDRSGEKSIFVETEGSVVKISGFKKQDSGFSYRSLSVEVDGRLVKKTDDLSEVKKIVSKHLSGLGLRK